MLAFVTSIALLPLHFARAQFCAQDSQGTDLFSIVTWGDPQNYVNQFRWTEDVDPVDGITRYQHLLYTTQWVLDDPQGFNFRLGIAPGDIVQTPFGCTTTSCVALVSPTDPDNPANQEADRLDAAFNVLYGVLPVIFSSGNHDADGPVGKTFGGYLNRWGEPFWETRAAQTPAWMFIASDLGEPSTHPQEGAGLNHFHLISIGKGRTIGVLSLSLDPPQVAVDWANSVLDDYSDTPTVVVSHSLIAPNGARTGGVPGYPPGLGGVQWAVQLVDTHPQIFLVVTGHSTGGEPDHPGKAYFLQTNSSPDRTHLELLHNMQGRAEGGSGFLGIITITPSLKLCEVLSYSPSLGVSDPIDPPALRSFACDLSRFGAAWGASCPIGIFPYEHTD